MPRNDLLREARDVMVTEVREATEILSDAYRNDLDEAKRWRAAVDRIHLAVATFAIAVDTTDPIQPNDETGRDPIFALSRFARHRPWCPEFNGPGDCTCGLYALLDSIRCTCGHKVSVHTDRDLSDVVGWPCSDCHSAACLGFWPAP